jgi:hypothetical protein
MKTSGIGVGGSIRTGVPAAVGASLVGVIFTDMSHARATTVNMDRNKIGFLMVGFPFSSDHSFLEPKTPLPKDEFFTIRVDSLQV